MLGAGVPTLVIDDDRFGPGRGTAQAVQVLMIMERVATCPPYQLRIKIGVGFSIVFE